MDQKQVEEKKVHCPERRKDGRDIRTYTRSFLHTVLPDPAQYDRMVYLRGTRTEVWTVLKQRVNLK
jgi:hypothetical protein